VPIGKAEVVRRGRDVTLCAIGLMTHRCLEAADLLAAGGIDAEVVDVLTLAPLDEATILESVTRTHKLVVVDEDTPTCSMARPPRRAPAPARRGLRPRASPPRPRR